MHMAVQSSPGSKCVESFHMDGIIMISPWESPCSRTIRYKWYQRLLVQYNCQLILVRQVCEQQQAQSVLNSFFYGETEIPGDKEKKTRKTSRQTNRPDAKLISKLRSSFDRLTIRFTASESVPNSHQQVWAPTDSAISHSWRWLVTCYMFIQRAFLIRFPYFQSPVQLRSLSHAIIMQRKSCRKPVTDVNLVVPQKTIQTLLLFHTFDFYKII